MREELEKFKSNLESMKTYSKNSLVLVFNQETARYEILYPKNKEAVQNKTSILYKNLKGEEVKIITKKGYIGIKPKKYIFKNRNLLKTFLFIEKEFYFFEELKEMEEQLNQELKSSRNR